MLRLLVVLAVWMPAWLDAPVGVPGDAVGLNPSPSAPPVGSNPLPPAPSSWPIAPFGMGGGAVAAGALAAARPSIRRRRFRDNDPAQIVPPANVTFVFVSGHGSDRTGTFETLHGLMGVDPERVVMFNWEWTGLEDHAESSSAAEAEEAAHALEAFLAGLAKSGDRIYLVGHSKGAVTITQMLAWWDAHPHKVQSGVMGAALLDPPIAGGSLGFLQSIGHFFGIASDGQFDPVQCYDDGCRDRRKHLGQSAGVEVFAVRNLDAGVTNFRDDPEGLRVYDLDDGEGPATDRIFGEGNYLNRVTEAHSSPLWSALVASCIVQESWRPGSCVWPVRPVRTIPPTPDPKRRTSVW